MRLIDNSLKSFYIRGRLPQWAVWSIAAALFALAWLGVSVWARAAALRDLAQHTDHWNPDGILQQETNYTCVPASIVMLLKDHGVDTTTLEVATISGTDVRGTSGGGIVETGRHFGFNVSHEFLDFDEFLSRGRPAVVVFRYNGIRHAAYVWPILSLGLIEVKDPVQGLLHFQKDGASEYFGRDRWDCYLFSRSE